MDICSKKYGAYLRYNLSGWGTLLDYLGRWGVNLKEFSWFNDGHLISPKTCQKVAEAISAHWHELTQEDKEWLRGHAVRWQRMAERGGAQQW